MSARGSNPLNYTFCVLILLFLYSADDVRYPISKNLNPLLNNGFRHRITLPDLDNDNHLFRSGRVVHSGTPEGTRTPSLQNRNLTLYPIELRAHTMLSLLSLVIISGLPPVVKGKLKTFF